MNLKDVKTAKKVLEDLLAERRSLIKQISADDATSTDRDAQLNRVARVQVWIEAVKKAHEEELEDGE